MSYNFPSKETSRKNSSVLLSTEYQEFLLSIK
jgi:hypothetical protein